MGNVHNVLNSHSIIRLYFLTQSLENWNFYSTLYVNYSPEFRLCDAFKYDDYEMVIFTLLTREMSVLLQVSSDLFMSNQHLCLNHVWVLRFSRLQQLHHACRHACHVTDKPPNRWKVTRPAHRNVLVMAARQQGLLRNVTELSAVTCSALVSTTERRVNGQIDHLRLWCQYGSWVSVVSLASYSLIC